MKINFILAFLAVISGLTAAFTNHSDRNNIYPTWKYETERIDGQKVHFVSATHLADLLFQKKRGITILDARDEGAYETYHIPKATHHKTLGAESEQDPSGTIIIYGNSAEEELFKSFRELPGRVFVLKGGIEQWYSQILFPDFLKYQVRNQDKLNKIVVKSRYFGGTPRNTQSLNISLRKSRFREGC